MRIHFSLLSARQVNSYPYYFNVHIEDIMQFPCVNRTAWKQAQQILLVFLFHGLPPWVQYISINFKDANKSSLDWDVPCANAYFATQPPQYFYINTQIEQ